jgi:gluconolactonase
VSQASPIRSISSRAERASFVTHDAAFGAVRGAAPRLARVVETDAHEGPVYVPGEDALYFTSLPRPGQVPAPGFLRVRVARIALDGDRFPLEPDRVSTVRENANVANGMASTSRDAWWPASRARDRSMPPSPAQRRRPGRSGRWSTSGVACG